MGYVWLERSTDNGSTWELMHYGKPIGNTLGKSPSMDYDPSGNLIVISYQEKYYSTYKCRYVVYHTLGNSFRYGDVDYAINPEPPVESLADDAQMVVSWNGNGNALFILKIGDNIHHTMCALTATTTTWIEDSKGSFDGSTITALSISTIKADVGTQLQQFHLAYQKSNTAIGYRNLSYSTHQRFVVTDEVNISTGNGFGNNYQPTIIESNGTVQVCWIGYREGAALDGGELPAGTTKVFYRSKVDTIWSVFSSYGNNVNSVNLNRNSNNSFAFAWSEGSSNINKFVKSNDITTVYNTNTTGRYVQVGNYPHLDLMRLNSFTTSTPPYYFTLSNTFDTVPEEEETEREGLIVQDTTAFYYSLGGIAVDDQTIEFIEIPDTASLSSQEELNSYLLSEPFNLTETSSFIYGVKYGVTDSLSAASALSDGRFVQFKVELIDDQTSEVLGTFDNVTFNSENIIPYESNAYQVNLQGIGNRICRLRLVTTDDLEFNYSLANSYNNETLLAKKGFTEIKLKGVETVTEYALEQNYPNPFNPATTIRYQIPNDGLVTLKVYDILGSEVATLVNEQKTTCRYEVNFNANHLSSGVYIFKLTAGSFVSSKKMLLIK